VSRRLVVVLGGTRSGKSRFGLARAAELARDRPVAFVATARPGDPELDARIAGHQRARPAAWPTLDAGPDLAATIAMVDPDQVVLVDGLTLWLSDLVGDAPADVDAVLDGPVAALLTAIEQRAGPVVIVSDELGLGMVPLDPGARAFRDLLGITHQRLAAAADEVHFMVAGLPTTLRNRPGE
jgi:adenosylcobinamide kinase/adenosylcobinamide-phosphate guanylyltransferase